MQSLSNAIGTTSNKAKSAVDWLALNTPIICDLGAKDKAKITELIMDKFKINIIPEKFDYSVKDVEESSNVNDTTLTSINYFLYKLNSSDGIIPEDMEIFQATSVKSCSLKSDPEVQNTPLYTPVEEQVENTVNKLEEPMSVVEEVLDDIDDKASGPTHVVEEILDNIDNKASEPAPKFDKNFVEATPKEALDITSQEEEPTVEEEKAKEQITISKIEEPAAEEEQAEEQITASKIEEPVAEVQPSKKQQNTFSKIVAWFRRPSTSGGESVVIEANDSIEKGSNVKGIAEDEKIKQRNND